MHCSDRNFKLGFIITTTVVAAAISLKTILILLKLQTNYSEYIQKKNTKKNEIFLCKG